MQALINQFHGQPARYRYFSGFSDGGPEALMETQRYPDVPAIALSRHALRQAVCAYLIEVRRHLIVPVLIGVKKRRCSAAIYPTRDEARSDVSNYVEMFYSPKRRHGTAEDTSPAEFERRHSQQLKFF